MRSLMAKRMQGISPFYVMDLLQRAKQLEQQGKDIIHMEIGEPDFPTPPAVVEAGQNCIKQGEVKYTAAAGLPELRAAIAQYYRDTYGVTIAKERVFITPGASGAFLLALGVTLNPGEEILMADPCYPCNDNFVQLFGGQTRFVNVAADSHYQLNAELIRRNWQENCKGVMIASPSNPTGTLITNEALREAIRQTQSLQGCFYSDEIYHGLVYGDPAASALQFSDDVFVINSFSKYFGMTGWRVGWLVVPEEFIDPTERLAQNIFIATPTHSQYAALASFLPENLRVLEWRRQQFAERRDFLYENLIRLGFEIECKPEGAFYIYANCRAFTDDSFRFAAELLETEGVAVTPGKDFGQNNNFFIRFAYTASIARMAEALQRLERFICR
nr:aminotransferase class I/II-fold pyridoxal phosphate-dependent enzyme [Methylomarinum vadi]